ncbi:MAG: nitroreductase family protein [Armatimonadota bacterium]|nr:nitroreductase family protein [Armatimonadota bacterium]MDR7421967.1 nitroreductase family protein [Armatimonadota bacterium]MDR7453497.1 nitroreductase family protein [Armatimonadota bacterium]MDR7456962.1 nitroreductase family protein [Armatimonadota bacterium]MDR7496485.1 nitroreductase family protein [Armatimonadota bacterium]
MDAVHRILAKRDLRTYADRPIPPDVLTRILEAGRRSGSARNRQPWEFVVATDAEVRRALARCGRFAAHLARAPAVVVIAVEGARDLFDAGRCAQSMMLAAWLLGVASCPVALHDERGARAALGLPEGPVLAPAVALGYPDPAGRGRLERVALRVLAGRGRKPLADLVSWNRYGNRA